MSKEEQRPWERIEKLVADSETERIEAYLQSLGPGDTARAVSRLDAEDQDQLMATLSPEAAAGLVAQVLEPQAVELIERLDPAAAASILEQLPSDAQADLIRDLDEPDAEAILSAMDPAEAEVARGLSEYPKNVAGGLMAAEYLSFPATITVAGVLEDLRINREKYGDYDVQYAYVTQADGKLVGVLRLRDLVLAPRAHTIDAIMIREPLAIRELTAIEELQTLFEQNRYFGLPVVNGEGVLVGVLRRVAVEEALAQLRATDLRKVQGVVWEELRTMPMLQRSRRRLAWLSVNIVLNILAASVIALYQETLASVIALAVFLPIISDMSGCSGNQAVAVSMRELTLGLIRPADALRVWLKEASVGVLNGLALGLLIGVVAWLWKGNPFLGLVVGLAMGLNTLVAVSLGGLVPLVLRRFKVDPAVASGPILTTVTDMCGFFLVLSLAAAMLSRLTGG